MKIQLQPSRIKKCSTITEPDESKLLEHTDDDPGEMCITMHNVCTFQVCVALIFIALNE